jgi:hypothetical protein
MRIVLTEEPSVASNGTLTKPRNYWPSTRPEKKQFTPTQAASTRGNPMALTRNFKDTVVEPVQSDASFAQALLDEAATLFLNGEPETARLILRDLVPDCCPKHRKSLGMPATPENSTHRHRPPSRRLTMSQTTKVFTTGRSQAVRLPAAFRFDTPEVFIRKDPVTGDIILSRRPDD